MVDINITGTSPGSTVVRAGPSTGDSSAVAVCLDVLAITLQDEFTVVVPS